MAEDKEVAQESCVALGEALTVAVAAEVKRKLIQQLQEPGDLILDPTGLQEVDVAGLQLLWATVHSCDAAGKKLRLKGASAVLESSLVEAGLGASPGRDTPWGTEVDDG